MRRRALVVRLAMTVSAGTWVFASVASCNAVLGIRDVELFEKKDSGDTDPPIIDDDDGGDTPVSEVDSGIPSRADLFQVAAGEAHSCARRPDGAVKCWGDHVQGQLGIGTLAADGGIWTVPNDVTGVTDAVDLSAGRSHNCIARRSGRAACWGFNFDGQLGNGETSNRSPSPVEVSGLTGVVAVAAGGNFSCALRAGGGVACWGANGAGQLGQGSDAPSATPVAVKDLNDAVSIAAGQFHACAVKRSGVVVCWGEGAAGQLGKAPAAPSNVPVPVDNVTDAALVAAGDRSTCAITKTGSVMCWGANEAGQLGREPVTGAPSTAGNVSNLSDATSIAVGRAHACAVRKTGAVVCWGAGDAGQLGDNVSRTPGEATSSFVIATGIQSGITVGAGGTHSCAALGTQVMCWGANDRGQLGTNSTTPSGLPVSVTGF